MASASRALRLARLPAALRGRLLRPVSAVAGSLLPPAAASRPSSAHARFLATSSLRDSSPSWNNRPPKETILLDGCDFEHWLVIMDPPPGNPADPDVPREEIIDGYIKTLAKVLGSEEEARLKIYSVSTRYYFAFGALVSEELSYKIKELPNVRWVLPDSYLDVKNKDYGGEPFINGEAVPYDPKYHEEWVRNNARANERSKRNDRPRSFDRSRNFERRENVQNFQNRDVPPGSGFNNPPPPFQQGMSHDAPPMHPAQSNMPPPPPPNAGAQPTYQHHASNPQAGYAPGAPGYQGGPPGYQDGNQGYKASTGGNMHGGPGPAYQSNPGYQGGSAYTSSSLPPFQGGGQPPYQSGNSPPYQGGGQLPYQSGNSPPYQGGGQPPYQSGNSPPYQGGDQPPYQSGNSPPYQDGGQAPYKSGNSPPYQGGNPNYGGAASYHGQPGNPNYQGTGAPPYEGRDGPGRNYQ